MVAALLYLAGFSSGGLGTGLHDESESDCITLRLQNNRVNHLRVNSD